MNLQSFNSKKYILTFFMSTCLLTSSFLSTSAKAATTGANFSDLVREVPKWKGQTVSWELYPTEKKQEEWRNNGLVPSFYQAAQDLGITSYNAKNLEDKNKSTRDRAKRDKVRVELYIQEIEEQDFVKNKETRIKQNKLPTFEEAIQDLAIDYDPKRITDKSQKVRHIEKEKRAKIDTYIAQVKSNIMTNKKKEYVDQNVLPKLQEVMKEFALNKGEANLYIKQIKDLMITNQSTNNQNTRQTLSSRIKTFGRERNTTQQSSDDGQDTQNSNNTNQISSRKIFDTAQNVNNSKNTEDTTEKTSRTPIKTGREKKQTYSFNPKKLFINMFSGKKNASGHTQSQQNIYKIIHQEKHIEEFKNLIKIDPIAALNLEVDSSYKKEAVDAILSNFDYYTIQKILFSDDKGQLDFNTNIDVKNRPTLKQLLDNSSEEQSKKIIDNISTYAKENVIPLAFQGKIQHGTLSDLLKLAAITDKTVAEKLLTLQLELKNDLHSHNIQGNNISPEVIKAINEVLREYNATAKDLSSSEIVKLANSFNNKGFEDSINIMSSSKEALTTQIYNLFGLSSQNKTYGNAPPPPPPPHPFGNSYLNKLTNTPELHALYDQFIQNSKTKNENTAKTNQDKTKNDTQERNEPATEYAKLYKQYRAETGGKKADDLQDQKIKKQADITNVIRQILTESYANQGADEKALVNLFSIPTPEVEEKAKEIFKELVQDPYIQDIIVNGNKTTITRRVILEKLFNEDTDDAAERIILSSCNISEDIKKPIKHELNQLKLIKEIDNAPTPFKQLEAADKKTSMLDQDIFGNRVKELINDPNKLTIAQQITFLTKEHTELKKVITTDQAQAKLDDLRTAILNAIKLEELTKASLPQNDFMAIVKAKDPALLQKFLKASVVKQENSNNLDQLSLALPSFSGMSDQQVRVLANKLNMSVILKTLKDYSQEKAKNHTHTGNMPPPPPPPGSKNSELAYLTGLGVTEDWIDRITKLNEDNKAPIFKTTTPKVYNFSSDIALRYKEFALSGQKSAGHKAKYSDTDLFKKAIDESVVLEHSKTAKVFDTSYITQIKEAIDNVHSDKNNSTQIEQEVRNIYISKLLELKKDKDFIRYVEDNIKPSKKRKDELTKAFNNPEALGTQIEQEVHDFYTSKLSELTKDNLKYQEKVREDIRTIPELNTPEVAARAEIGQQQIEENIKEAVIEAFNTANSDFIGPRTEIGQEEVHNIYREKYVDSAKDPELLLFVEQLLKESTELEQKYGSDVQPENKDTEESFVERMKKQFQQENEVKNDESSTEDDKNTNDTELGSSDLKAILSTSLSSSNDSENDKSLLELSSSDAKDEGYETDDEELKKDIALESEEEAVNILPETEEIAKQDEAVLKEQISNKTNETVALLDGVGRMTLATNKQTYSNILNNRLTPAAAGDEEVTVNRGVWISGLYGINKQGAWKNIPKYQSRTAGVTIGLDAEFINSHDVIGIAYSRLESQVKYNKKLGKTAVNGHLLSIYGLKELIKGFSLQAITSYGHNYIKNKATSINNIIGKYQNNNVSFETLLNYKYRTKHDLHFIPSIGFKYDYSRASNYKEYNIDIENLMIQKKSNQSFESSLGGKIVFKPIATGSNIVLTPSLHGNIERHFNNKNTKVNAKATFKGQTLQQTIILPKQPKLGYNVGSNILMSRKNINVLLEYNYYTHRKYQSHQGLVKLKVNL